VKLRETCLSFVIAFSFAVASYPAVLYLTERGATFIFGIWFLPGKIITSFTTIIIPSSWIVGTPEDEAYWPQASYAGFTIFNAIIFWGIALFLLWWLFSVVRGRKQQ
jgi:hypothetical protein